MSSSSRRYNPYLLAGNRVTPTLRKPGAAQDGQTAVWDNAQKKFKPGASGGGGGGNIWKGDWNPATNTYPAGSNNAGEIYRLYNGDPIDTLYQMPDGLEYVQGTLAMAVVNNADANTPAHWRLF